MSTIQSAILYAILYLRVSDQEQVKGFSLESQERECREWCAHHGYEVVKVFREEGKSAKSRAKRTIFEQALSYIDKSRKKIHALVVINSDRFARNALDHLMVKDILLRNDCRLCSVSENFDDSIWGRFFETVKAGLNQAENEERARKTKHGMKEACLQGYWPWRPPIGYVRHWTADGKPSMKPDPIMGPLMAKAFKLYGTGQYTQKSVLDKMTALGLRTDKGKPLGQQRFRSALENPLYAGIVKSSLIDHPTQGLWPALVDPDTFQIIQGLITGALSDVPHVRERQEFPMRGFVVCGVCGKPMGSSWSRGRNGTKYPYYHCPKCRGQSLRAEKMEGAFAEFLNDNIRIDPDYARAIRQIVLRQYKMERTAHDVERAAKEQTRKKMERKRSRLEDLLIDETIDQETYDRKMKEVQADLARAILDERDSEDSVVLTRAALDRTLQLLLEPGESWRNACSDMKIKLQGALFDSGISWTKKDGFGTAVTDRAVNDLRSIDGSKTNLASPICASWNHLARLTAKIEAIYQRYAA